MGRIFPTESTDELIIFRGVGIPPTIYIYTTLPRANKNHDFSKIQLEEWRAFAVAMCIYPIHLIAFTQYFYPTWTCVHVIYVKFDIYWMWRMYISTDISTVGFKWTCQYLLNINVNGLRYHCWDLMVWLIEGQRYWSMIWYTYIYILRIYIYIHMI